MVEKCSECIAYEPTEYISPFHIVHICHQGNMILKDLSLAKECPCFEQKEKDFRENFNSYIEQ